MTVQGLISGGVFCQDMTDIIVQHVSSGELQASFQITDADGSVLSTFTEVYHPDASDSVCITGLSEVMESYLTGGDLKDMFNPDGGASDIGGFADLAITLTDGDDEEEVTQRFYQCANRTGLHPSSYNYFLNRFRTRHVFNEQLVTCAYIKHGQTLKCKIAYMNDDDESCLKTVTLQATGAETGHIIVHQYKLSYLAGLADAQPDRVMYVALELMNGTNRIDYMQYWFDREENERKGFVFKNPFGVPEHVILTGQDKHTAELDGTYSWIGRKYMKTHTDLTTLHTLCTGWIDEDTHDSVKDAIVSSQVFLIDDLTIVDEVTVTDIDLDYEQPRTTPLHAFITYRVSNKVQQKFSRVRQRAERIFDDSFDNTFN